MSECSEEQAAKFLTALAREDMRHWARHQAKLETESAIPTREILGRYNKVCARLIPIVGTMELCERTDALKARALRGAKPHYGKGSSIVRELLRHGPMSASDLMSAAKGRGLTVDQLRRGRECIGAVRVGEGNAAVWSLPRETDPGRAADAWKNRQSAM